MPKRFLSVFFAFLVAFLLCGSLFAARNVMTCDWCGKKISSNASFLRSEDKNFCSEKCFDQYAESLLPVCDVCGRRFKEGFTSEGKNYCSKACLETTFHECVHCHRREPNGVILGENIFLCDYCKDLPSCFSCKMPLDKFAKDLGDGRKICRECARNAIFSQSEMDTVMKELRRELADKFKMSTEHEIKYELCDRDALKKEIESNGDGEQESGSDGDRDELKKQSGSDGERELGLFIVNTRVLKLFGHSVRKKEEYRILILNGLAPDFFRGVGAHELAHDWMSETLPHIEDPQIREGFAEFVAWAYAKAEKLDRIPWRMEYNTDEVYGDGFRKVRDMMGDARTASEWKKILLKACPAPAGKK